MKVRVADMRCRKSLTDLTQVHNRSATFCRIQLTCGVGGAAASLISGSPPPEIRRHSSLKLPLITAATLFGSFMRGACRRHARVADLIGVHQQGVQVATLARRKLCDWKLQHAA